MNIRTEQIGALFSQQELHAKKPVSSQNSGGMSFAATFAEQAALGDAENGIQSSVSVPPVQASVVQQMLLNGVENISAPVMNTASTGQALEQASGALDMWDSYAQKLRMPGNEGNLRDAYALLEGIESQVSTLKAQNKDALEQNPDLANLVNELEIMSTTEKIKFNRGDYAQ